MVYQDEAVRLKATFKDFSMVLVDPSSITLTILDPAGTVIVTKSKADMTNPSTGVYYYQYDLTAVAPIGVWIAKWLGTIAGLHKPGKIGFNVEAF